MRRFWLRRAAAAVLVTLTLFAAPVRAQDDDDKKPARFQEPGISYRQVDKAKPYIDWLAGVLIIAACLLIAVKNPHRTHLD